MKIVILPSARDDLSAGFAFYEDQAEGLGTLFLESLFSDIDALNLLAGVHPMVFGLYRSLSKRFPYAIYYSIESDLVTIKGILDCRQNPRRVRKRFDRPEG